MRPRIVSLLAGREVRAAVRGRWFLVGAVSFTLLSVAVAALGMAGAERWGVSALDRTAAALLNLTFLFVPLLTLPLGAAAVVGEGEDGTLAYLVAQPVTRAEVFTGKILGLAAAVTMSILLGFGASAILVGWRGGVPATTFLALAGGAWLLGVVTIVLGVLLSTLARSRISALAAAVAAWVVLVFLCDFGVLALAAAQVLGSEALFGIAIANPLQSIKTLVALFVSTRLEVLGPVGVAAVQALGRGPLAALLIAAAAAWAFVGAGAGWAVFRRANLS